MVNMVLRMFLLWLRVAVFREYVRNISQPFVMSIATWWTEQKVQFVHLLPAHRVNLVVLLVYCQPPCTGAVVCSDLSGELWGSGPRVARRFNCKRGHTTTTSTRLLSKQIGGTPDCWSSVGAVPSWEGTLFWARHYLVLVSNLALSFSSDEMRWGLVSSRRLLAWAEISVPVRCCCLDATIIIYAAKTRKYCFHGCFDNSLSRMKDRSSRRRIFCRICPCHVALH